MSCTCNKELLAGCVHASRTQALECPAYSNELTLRRVQFDRRELGVELVKDIDVMPIDPGDCLPPTVLAAQRDLLLNGRRWSAGVPLRPRLTAVPGQVTPADSLGTRGSSILLCAAEATAVPAQQFV